MRFIRACLLTWLVAGCAAPLPVPPVPQGGTASSPAPDAGTPPSPRGPGADTTANLASPVTIDVGDVPLAVLAGLPVRLPVRLAGTASVRWRLAAGDEGRATLTPDGVFTGHEPGWAVAIAEAAGQSASVRIAVTPAEGPARRLPVFLPSAMTAPGFQVITDETTWRRFWAELTALSPDAARWGPPEIFFEHEAVLIYFTGIDQEGNPRLAQPEPLIATIAPRIAVVFPERRSVFKEIMASNASPSDNTFFWAIPRAAATHEAVAVRWNHVTEERGIPTPWIPPAVPPSPQVAMPQRPAPRASAPDPDGPTGDSVGGTIAFTPATPCLGTEVTVSGTNFAGSPVTLSLRAYPPYRLTVGAVPPAPTGTRTLAVLPVDESQRFTLGFALPPPDARGWPFRLEPQAAYMLEYGDAHVGGSLQMPLCGWAPPS